MVKIVDAYEEKRKQAEVEDRLYSLAEETFGKERCNKGLMGNVFVRSPDLEETCVTISPLFGKLIIVRNEADYEHSLRFAEMAEGIVGEELTVRKEYKKI